MANDTKDERFTDTKCDGLFGGMDARFNEKGPLDSQTLRDLTRTLNKEFARECIARPGPAVICVMLEAEDKADNDYVSCFEDTNGAVFLSIPYKMGTRNFWYAAGIGKE